jgi:hypothetical protein
MIAWDFRYFWRSVISGMFKERSFYGQRMNTVFKGTHGNENELRFVSMDEGSGSL